MQAQGDKEKEKGTGQVGGIRFSKKFGPTVLPEAFEPQAGDMDGGYRALLFRGKEGHASELPRESDRGTTREPRNRLLLVGHEAAELSRVRARLQAASRHGHNGKLDRGCAELWESSEKGYIRFRLNKGEDVRQKELENGEQLELLYRSRETLYAYPARGRWQRHDRPVGARDTEPHDIEGDG